MIAEIDSQTPISKETMASLSLQGVTGLLYIDLLADADLKRRMAPVPSEQYPVIDSVKSNFDLFLASLPDLVGRAAEVADRAGRVLSEENMAAFNEHVAQHRAECGDVARHHARRRRGGGGIQGHGR